MLKDVTRVFAAAAAGAAVLGSAASVALAVSAGPQANSPPVDIEIAVDTTGSMYASIQREKDDKAFYEVTVAQRTAIAVTYFFLVVFLGHQTWMTVNRLSAFSR